MLSSALNDGVPDDGAAVLILNVTPEEACRKDYLDELWSNADTELDLAAYAWTSSSSRTAPGPRSNWCAGRTARCCSS
jgi:hypothetical protein